MNKIIMQLVALLAASLTFNKSTSSDEDALKQQVADRDKQLVDLHSQLDALGQPLTDDQKAQVQQLVDAAHAALPDTAVAPPAVVTVAPAATDAPAQQVATDQGAAPVVVSDSSSQPSSGAGGSSTNV